MAGSHQEKERRIHFGLPVDSLPLSSEVLPMTSDLARLRRAAGVLGDLGELPPLASLTGSWQGAEGRGGP